MSLSRPIGKGYIYFTILMCLACLLVIGLILIFFPNECDILTDNCTGPKRVCERVEKQCEGLIETRKHNQEEISRYWKCERILKKCKFENMPCTCAEAFPECWKIVTEADGSPKIICPQPWE